MGTGEALTLATERAKVTIERRESIFEKLGWLEGSVVKVESEEGGRGREVMVDERREERQGGKGFIDFEAVLRVGAERGQEGAGIELAGEGFENSMRAKWFCGCGGC